MRLADRSYRPTPDQEILLRASLLKGEPSLQAWMAWAAEADLDRVDPGSYRLLPLLYRNLQEQGVRHPLMTKLRGIYRMTWYKNGILFRALEALLKCFEEAGIPTMILKGAALIPLHYKAFGLRPMEDFDVLVPEDRRADAMRVARDAGYSEDDVDPARLFSYSHAVSMKNAGGMKLDLHWRVFPAAYSWSSDLDFWEGAVPMNLPGVSTTAMNPADLLLHVCVHAAMWNPVPPVRWAADAAMIIRTSPGRLDWDRLLDMARRKRLIVPLKETLLLLQKILGIDVPGPFLKSLHAVLPSQGEIIHHRQQAEFSTLLGRFPSKVSAYLHIMEGAKATEILAGLPRYFQMIWGMKSPWLFPFEFMRRGMLRLGRALGPRKVG